jgi:hypothetical protein
MAEKTKNGSARKVRPTREILQDVLRKLERQDKRFLALETQQTLLLSAIQRQGQLTEDVNRRCMEKLGMKCPLLEEEDDG